METKAKEKATISEAIKIFGDYSNGSFFHQGSYLLTFGIEIKESDLPPINFSVETLKKARDENFGLYLLANIYEKKLFGFIISKIEIDLDKIISFYRKEKRNDKCLKDSLFKEGYLGDFFKERKLRCDWFLAPNYCLDATGFNFLDQIEMMIDHLARKKWLFENENFSSFFNEAQKEFIDKKWLLKHYLDGKSNDSFHFRDDFSKLKIGSILESSAELAARFFLNKVSSKPDFLKGENIVTGSFDLLNNFTRINIRNGLFVSAVDPFGCGSYSKLSTTFIIPSSLFSA